MTKAKEKCECQHTCTIEGDKRWVCSHKKKTMMMMIASCKSFMYFIALSLHTKIPQRGNKIPRWQQPMKIMTGNAYAWPKKGDEGNKSQCEHIFLKRRWWWWWWWLQVVRVMHFIAPSPHTKMIKTKKN